MSLRYIYKKEKRWNIFIITLELGYHAAPGGFLLLTSFLFLVATFIVEKCFGAEKEFLKNNNVVMPDEQEDAKDDQAARGGEYQQVQ